MATQQTRSIGRIAVAPSVIALFLWMIVPLAMTIWFSFLRYNLLDPNPACSLLTPGQLMDEANRCLAGTSNYYYFLTDPAFFKAMRNSLLLVFWVLVISVVGGTLLALLLDQAIYGRNFVRLMVIAPFFVMPTVSALVWKNMMMHPVQGFLAWITKSLGFGAIDWFAHYPMTAIVIMVSWQWLPFACLIFITSLQSLDRDQMEAAGHEVRRVGVVDAQHRAAAEQVGRLREHRREHRRDPGRGRVDAVRGVPGPVGARAGVGQRRVDIDVPNPAQLA